MCHGQSRWTSFDPSPYRHPTTLFRIHFPQSANHTPRGPAPLVIARLRLFPPPSLGLPVPSQPRPPLPNPHQTRPHGHISYHVDLFLFSLATTNRFHTPHYIPFLKLRPGQCQVYSLYATPRSDSSMSLQHSRISHSDASFPFARQHSSIG